MIEKIYKVSIPGAEEGIKKMSELSLQFDKARDAKKRLNEQLEKSQKINDSEEVAKLKAAIQGLEAEMKKLSTERAKAAQQAEAQMRAEKHLAELAVINAKAEKERTASLIAQQKEIDRQIALEEKLNRQRQKNNSNSDVEAGSQRDRQQQMKELREFVFSKNTDSNATIDFRGLTLSIQEATEKYRELSFAEQDFRRQFMQSGTLVGEYSKGILDAFQKAGMDDLIKKQTDKAKAEVDKLDKEFAELQQQISKVGVSADGSFEKLERQLIDNRKEAMNLQTQIERVETQMNGVGSIGKQVSDSISKGFKEMRGQLMQVIVGYVSFNKIMSEVSAGMEDAKQLEGVKAAFDNLNDPNLLSNLRAATKGTVSDLELMKQAVQAKNFEIPLETLGNLMEFARRRAKDTGESVEYLTQSIVTGIGRKSPLILDNLGISATRLKEKMNGVTMEASSIGDVAKAVGKIIEEENARSGKEIDTNSEKLAAQQAKWENIRAEIGQKFLPVASAVTTFFVFLLGNLPVLTAILATYTLGWALLNKEMLIAKTRQIAINTLFPIFTVLLGGASNAMKVYGATINLVSSAKIKLISLMGNPVFRIFGLILAGLVVGIKAFSAQIESAVAGVDKYNQKQRFLNEALATAQKEIASTIAKEKALLSIINDRNLQDSIRISALSKLKDIMGEYGKALTLENINTNEGTEALKKFNAELLKNAQIRAGKAIADREQAKLDRLIQQQSDVANARVTGGSINTSQLDKDLLQKYYNQQGRSASKIGQWLGDNVGIDFTYSGKDLDAFASIIEKEIESQLTKTSDAIAAQVKGENDANVISIPVDIDIAKLKEDLDAANKAINEFRGSKSGLDTAIKHRDELQKKLDELLNKNKDKKYSGSKLTGQQKDLFKDIDTELALLTAELTKQREQQVIGEQTYLVRLNNLQTEANDKKMALLKGSNAEERKVRAELELDTIKKNKELNDKLFEQNKKAIEKQKALANENSKIQYDEYINTPGLTESQKTAAKKKLNEELLNTEIRFNEQMLLLELNYRKQSTEIERERALAIRKLRKELGLSSIEDLEAELKDLQKLEQIDVSGIEKVYAKLRAAISGSSRSSTDKFEANKDLDKAEKRTILSAQIEALKKQIPILKQLLANGVEAHEEYNRALETLYGKQNDLNELNNSDIEEKWNRNLSVFDNLKIKLQRKIRDIFGIKKGSEDENQLNIMVGEVIAQSYNLAQQAMESYYDAERAKIERSLEITQERIDLETEQRLALAESDAERESIQKRAEQQKKDAAKKAAEDNKKIQLKQARIAYLSELANIWSSVWKTGDPYSAMAMGLLFSGLATARYSMTEKGIMNTKYEKGGRVEKNGGKIRGKRHRDGGYKFNHEAEDGELFVINRNSASQNRTYTVSGTPSQIASKINEVGGGVAFNPGAILGTYEKGGYLGANVKAPVYIPSSNLRRGESSNLNEELLTLIYEQNNRIEQQNNRIDNIRVHVVTNDVTTSQNKLNKKAQIGTL